MPSLNEPNDALDGYHHLQGASSDGGQREVDVSDAGLPCGIRVQVRCRFDGTWASGFQVFSAQPGGLYLVRRLSDHAVLPATFAENELRVDPLPLPGASRSSWTPPAVA